MTYINVPSSSVLGPPHTNLTFYESLSYNYRPTGQQLKDVVRDLAHQITRGTLSSPGAIILDLDVNNLIIFSEDQYLLMVHKLASYIYHIKKKGIETIWVDMAAVPPLNLTKIDKSGPHRHASNSGTNALNFFTYETLTRAGATYIPQWRLTDGWRNDLVCPGETHSMCFNKTPSESPRITPPGHATAQLIMQNLCH